MSEVFKQLHDSFLITQSPDNIILTVLLLLHYVGRYGRWRPSVSSVHGCIEKTL